VLCDNGNIIFQATLRDLPATQKQGLWLAKNGTITRLMKTGQTLQFNGVSKALSAVHIFQFTPNLSGQTRSFDPGSGTITYQATFADGTWGIYLIAGDQ
jgi:hypothetical protein